MSHTLRTSHALLSGGLVYRNDGTILGFLQLALLGIRFAVHLAA